MYRIAICDDELRCLEMIEGKVREYCRKKQITIGLNTYSDSDTLMEDIEGRKMYDAYILDIEMGGYTGIEVARAIGERSNTALIVFLTAYQNYAMEACGMNIMRYALKESLDREIPGILETLFDKLEGIRNSAPYVISNQRKYIKLLQREIIYIYKQQKNVVFVLVKRKEEKDRTTLQEVYKKIGSNEMYFLDKGIILNICHVRKVVDNSVIMTDDYKIPSSVSRITALKEFLQRYWGGSI